MGAAVVYGLVTLGFIGLLFFSNKYGVNFEEGGGGSSHRRAQPGARRLIVRSLGKQQRAFAAFDPVIASLERKREDRTWEREYFQSHHLGGDHHRQESANPTPPAVHPESPPDASSWDYTDPEDYLNDSREFNISHRIVSLFPLIDSHPPDGIISHLELQEWHHQAGMKEAQHRADRELETTDKNHDGMVSVAEYTAYSYPDGTGNESSVQMHVDTWMELFAAADSDGDNLLNNTEFNKFLHPQDSSDPKLLQLLLKHDVRDHDNDHDGKLSLAEFNLGLYDLLRSYEDDEQNHDNVGGKSRDTRAKEKFDELDKNKDGFLTEDELAPTLERLHPGELYYAKHQADYLMEQADINKDGHLTIEEMLENPYVFYSTAYAHNDYEDYLHEEF